MCDCSIAVPGSTEWFRRHKAENNAGCGTGNTGCDQPSLADPASPRGEWEKIYGKLVTKVTETQDAVGHTVWEVVRTPCPVATVLNEKPACCSFRYKVTR